MIEAKVFNTGTWFKITIVSVEYGFSQRLNGEKWVNTTEEPQRFEKEVLTLGNSFVDDEDAYRFMKTPPFKALIKTLQKSWPC